MMDWNLLATILIISAIILFAIWKLTGMSLFDLIDSFKDYFGDKKDSVQEIATQVYE